MLEWIIYRVLSVDKFTYEQESNRTLIFTDRHLKKQCWLDCSQKDEH